MLLEVMEGCQMCRHFCIKWSAEGMLMRPCKDHLALEEGALPKAAELCIAIPGNVDKEHFILEKKPCYWCFSSSISKQLAGF